MESAFHIRSFEALSTIVLIVVLVLIREGFKVIIKNHIQKYKLDIDRRQYANKFFSGILFCIFLVGISIIWNVTLKGLTFYLASIFTIVGVALFATWSFLGNITASIILFFNSPIRIGSYIEIMDGDNTVKGKVLDTTFFTIMIQSDDGNTIAYPNNLAIQKPIKQLKTSD